MRGTLFRTAICCALQDMTVPAGVIITVPRREFYELWSAASNGKCLQTVLASVLAREGLEQKDVIEIRDFKKTISRYGAYMYRYFRQHRGVSEVFLEKCDWLGREPFSSVSGANGPGKVEKIFFST